MKGQLVYHHTHVAAIVPPRSPDTEPDAERVQVELLRAASVARRLRLAVSVTETVVGAARRGIAMAHPHASPSELDLKFVEIHYGANLARELRADLERRAHERSGGS